MAKPTLMPPVMDDSGRITRDEAARILGVSPAKVTWLTAQKHLTGNRRSVTLESVDAEKKWRATAPRGRKARRLLRDTGTAITWIFDLVDFLP